MTEAATNNTSECILRLVRHYPHPKERIFAAWTRPEQLVKWWGPKGVRIPHCQMDLHVDGGWETTMRNADGSEFFVSGKYLEITPSTRLVFTWAWRNDDIRGHETTVTVEFEEKDNGTKLTLTQELFESIEARRLHNEGWVSSLDCLSEHLDAS